MDEVVRDYEDGDLNGVRRVGDPINGTAFFPGGHGVWRGLAPHGSLPQAFPEQSVMFVGHNFDKVKGYERSLKRGIEIINGPTWRKLREYIAFAELQPEECFFTNALVGLQPEKSRGPLKATDRFRAECRHFLGEQIRIVQPRAIISLGPVASEDLRGLLSAVPTLGLMHPYATIRREGLAQAEGVRVKHFLGSSANR
jgi:uracil-DNA glycosylase family 4